MATNTHLLLCALFQKNFFSRYTQRAAIRTSAFIPEMQLLLRLQEHGWRIEEDCLRLQWSTRRIATSNTISVRQHQGNHPLKGEGTHVHADNGADSSRE